MNSETKHKVLEYLVIINQEAKAIDNFMNIIDSSIIAIRELKKDIDRHYNNIIIAIHKE